MERTELDSGFYKLNRKKLSKLLPPGSLAVLNANDVMPRNGDLPYPYRQQSDVLYLCGIRQEATVLLLFPAHPNPVFREVLFIRDPDPVAEEWSGHLLTREEAAAISGIRNIQFLGDFEGMLTRLMTQATTLFLNLNEYPKFSTEVPYRDLRFARRMREQFPLHSFGRLAPLMASVRMKKEEAEIDAIRTALAITSDAFHRVLDTLRPGMFEYEIQAEMVYEMIRQGSPGPAYPPIIGAGKNACVLHYTENRSVCQDGDLVLMDFGAEYMDYAADLSRTLPVNGRYTPRQRRLYEAVHRVMKSARNFYVPGETIDSINRQTRLLMLEELAKLGLIGKGSDVQDARLEKMAEGNGNPQQLAMQFMKHGVAHHLGLDVHDIVLPEEKLCSGMILTCEPGLYLPEEGIGIRIENDILVAEKPVDLCEGIPSEAEEIEALILSNKK
jgi:Xaa-Pro aminopeptidase